MGRQLKAYYEKAKQIGGIKAQMRLAILTLMPSSKAEIAPDSAENIKKFMNAFSKLEKEFRTRNL